MGDAFDDMARPDDAGDFAALALRFLDGETSAEEDRQLHAALRDDAGRRAEFVAICREVGALREVLAPAQAAVSTPESLASSARMYVRRRRRRRIARAAAWIAPFAAAAAVLCAALVLQSSGTPGAARALVPRAAEIAGAVSLLRPDGTRALAADELLAPGDALRTGPGGRAVLTYEDHTTVELAARSELSFEAHGRAKRMRLARGSLAADVTPQPRGHPLVVATPQADVEVAGTRFTVDVSPSRTRVAVARGVVVVRPAEGAHGPPAEVAAGRTMDVGAAPPAPPAVAVAPRDPFGPPEGGWAFPAPTGLHKVRVRGIDRPEAYYLIGVPDGYTPEQAWPAVVLLHGVPVGRPEHAAAIFLSGMVRRGAICIVPRALNERLLEWNYPDESMYLLHALFQVAGDYRLDPRRIYLVGHYGGGGGVWANAALLGDVIAGAAPLSGWYKARPPMPDEWLRGVPLYIIHGARDVDIPVDRSRRAVENLRALGVDVRTFTERPDPAAFGDAACIYREIPDADANIFTPWETRSKDVALMADWLLARVRPTAPDVDAARRRIAGFFGPLGWRPEGILGVYDEDDDGAAQPAAQETF